MYLDAPMASLEFGYGTFSFSGFDTGREEVRIATG